MIFNLNVTASCQKLEFVAKTFAELGSMEKLVAWEQDEVFEPA